MARQMQDIKLAGVITGGYEVGEDLAIAAGDFVNVESTAQHQRQLIMNNKGDFKQNPTICVGAFTYVDDEGGQGVVRDIVQQFMQDGMEVVNMQPDTDSVADSTVTIFPNAFYV